MDVNTTLQTGKTQSIQPLDQSAKKSASSPASGTESNFANHLNAALQSATSPLTGTATAAASKVAAQTPAQSPIPQTSVTQTANNQSAALASLLALLMENQMNSMLSSSLGSTGLDSSGGSSGMPIELLSEMTAFQGMLGSGGTGSGTTSASGTAAINSLMEQSLLPMLLDSTGGMSLSGGGLPSLSGQIPLGTLSIPTIPATPSSTTTGAGTSGGVSTGSTGNANQTTIDQWIDQLAPRYGLSPKLIKAVVTEESGYSPTATSSAGAMGLMQLMPGTAAELGVSNPYDPLANLQGGMQYLSRLVSNFHGNLAFALAAYNAGSNAVKTYGGIPPYPETERYVRNILALMNQ